MNNASTGFNDADSVKSFGDRRRYSEGGGEEGRPNDRTQHTMPTPELQEDLKERNSSSDTANFFQNYQTDLEPAPNINLSFDNESAVGSNPNPIHLAAANYDANESISGPTHNESYYSHATNRIPSEAVPQNRNLNLVPPNMGIPQRPPPLVLNNANLNAMFGRERERDLPLPNIEDDDARTRLIPGIRESYYDIEEQQHHRRRVTFEEQLEEVADDLVYVVNSERNKIRESKASLKEQKISFEEFCKDEKEKLNREKKLWAENIKKAKEMYCDPKDIIEINVGGTHKLAVSRNIMCKAENSALSAMFSGRHKLQEHKGRVFIDRDGQTFTLVVSFLRNGKIPIFSSKSEETSFYEELEYWQIPISLTNNIHCEIPVSFDPLWCATTLRLESENLIVRKHGKIIL